jgi:vanillate O-demethylase ferredoxin subunit
LIAGGIGVTPMLSMIARLDELGRAWELHYAARTRSQAAFLDRLTPREAAHVIFSGEPGVARLDMAAVIAAAPPGAHIYCCGPPGMLAAFETLTARLAPGHAHVEYFTADVAVATEGDYILDLRRSGKTIKVSPGDTMLDALLTEGVDVAFACTEGVCGTCEVKVLEGIPDHRDHFLTAVSWCAVPARKPPDSL